MRSLHQCAGSRSWKCQGSVVPLEPALSTPGFSPSETGLWTCEITCAVKATKCMQPWETHTQSGAGLPR